MGSLGIRKGEGGQEILYKQAFNNPQAQRRGYWQGSLSSVLRKLFFVPKKGISFWGTKITLKTALKGNQWPLLHCYCSQKAPPHTIPICSFNKALNMFFLYVLLFYISASNVSPIGLIHQIDQHQHEQHFMTFDWGSHGLCMQHLNASARTSLEDIPDFIAHYARALPAACAYTMPSPKSPDPKSQIVKSIMA